MATNPSPQQGDGGLFPQAGDQLRVEPLRPKPSRRNMELERLFEGLRFALGADLDAARREILERIREVSTSVDLIAQELASRQNGTDLP